MSQHKMNAAEAVMEGEQEVELQMTWQDLDLERDIYRQEDSGISLSAVLLVALAVPVAVYLFSMLGNG